jgi:hypothetical protein
VDGLLWGHAFDATALVNAVSVVQPEFLNQVTLQTGVLGNEVASKGRFPALLEEGLLDALNAAIALRPAGADVRCAWPGAR